jgi:hypothetical protein
MVKRVYAYKTGCNGTVYDTLSEETEKIRHEGYSIFGINEGDSFRNPTPGILQTRLVEIFYE